MFAVLACDNKYRCIVQTCSIKERPFSNSLLYSA
ncbi:hypothetical protein CoNPh11_CDS0217 [Staphylococcus phage S-CoN_Ph11]|nr:hypothetical protein CoNPh11_CDS0217 [Staphylococcus phage S-CoN_Ph11]